MDGMHYAGLDVHKKTISFCIRRADGGIVHEGVIAANRTAVSEWMKSLPDRCTSGMEATMFTGWLFDHLTDSGMTIRVAHPAMLKAIWRGSERTIPSMRGSLRTSSGAIISRSAIW